MRWHCLSRNPKDGPKKAVDRSQKEGEQRVEKAANVSAGKNAAARPEAERCCTHHKAKIAEIRARDPTRPRNRWTEP
jgi:hypothetical protein